ncbi:protein phosphatase 1 regulatory subunit 36-like [Haliotis rufescens]|uniref:protein phosphatase 1 regulatory subunit 36-like n=1 Tax=Haliotis rufescens TaxID=6454 RepID=UPI00201ED8EA|nr:protein phosphatase 1 regulatory subunit 36-like [Haliotis rufescens]
MAKVAAEIFELPPLPGPTSGRWVWRDGDGGRPSLEFISNNANADRQDKRRKAKEHGRGRGDRVASSVARGQGLGRGRGQARPNTTKSPHPSKKDTTDNPYITLENVKVVAFERMTEADQSLVPESFDSLRGTKQFDTFLMYLLSYFNCFFEKMNQENKKNPMYIEPSLSEKMAYADACARLDVAQRLLGQSYCVLVLGLGLEDQHHMGCGQSRVSSTYKDRSMFERFYVYCTYIVWITFRRKEFAIVKKEIGRMLRSDTFNPAIRVKYAPEESKEEQKPDKDVKVQDKIQERIEEKKLTPAEYRRLHPRRPAIKSIINQRSPAVISILPSPKEQSHWLFKRARPVSPNSLGRRDHDEEEEEEEQEMIRSLTINTVKLKIGIIGEASSGFNKVTLMPLGTENEEEEGEGGDGQQKEMSEDANADKSQTADRGMSRQQTSVSHVTTEVNDDD